jgi:hypothetical protein
MAEYLGDDVHIVADVHEELKRKSKEIPALATLLDSGWPSTEARRLSIELRDTVAAVLMVQEAPEDDPGEDQGEYATVFYAEERRDAGEVFVIATDDRTGKTLAREKGMQSVNTPQLLVEMVCAGALSYGDGRRVWQACVPRAGWKDYEDRIKADCPKMVPSSE